MKRELKLELYSDDNRLARRSIDATITGGELTVELTDIGKAVDMFFGSDDLEMVRSGIPTDRMRQLLGAADDRELLRKLKERFGTNDGFDRFDAFLTEHGIEHSSGSWY